MYFLSSLAIFCQPIADEFIRPLCGVIRKTSLQLERNQHVETNEDVYLTLLTLWALCANNKKCRVILKKQYLITDLKQLLVLHRYSHLCQHILSILEE